MATRRVLRVPGSEEPHDLGFCRRSAQRSRTFGIEDWKSFVRLHIDKEGNLRLYPVGIPQVPTHWQLRSSGLDEQAWFEIAGQPDGSRLIDELVTLIHEPIDVPPNEAQRAALTAPPPIVRDPPHDIFISYSRADAEWVNVFLDALRIEAVAAGITNLRVFIDTESLRLREYWRTRIPDEIARCHAFLAIWTPAYVTAWHAQGVCFEESEAARDRARGDRDLLFDIFAKEAQLPDVVRIRQIGHLKDVELKTLSSQRKFKELCTPLLNRIKTRRRAAASRHDAGGGRGSDRPG